MTPITKQEVRQTDRIYNYLKSNKEWRVSRAASDVTRSKEWMRAAAGYGLLMGAVVGCLAATILVTPLALGTAGFLGVMGAVATLGAVVVSIPDSLKLRQNKKELCAAKEELAAFRKNPGSFIGAKLEEQRVDALMQAARVQRALADAARAVEDAKYNLRCKEGSLAELQSHFAPAAQKPATAQTAQAPANDAGKKAAPKKATAGKKAAPAKGK